MSMYTELVLACELKQKTPTKVIKTLGYMTRTEDYPFNKPPEHPFFQIEGWIDILLSYSSEHKINFFHYDHITETYQLNIRASIKNYNQEYEHFLDWLAPSSETEGFVGYMICEVDDDPILIYFEGGKAYLATPNSVEIEEAIKVAGKNAILRAAAKNLAGHFALVTSSNDQDTSTKKTDVGQPTDIPLPASPKPVDREENTQSAKLLPKVASLATELFVAHYENVYSLAFSPDGKFLASSGRYEEGTLGEIKPVKIWKVANWEEAEVGIKCTKTVYAVAFSPDGLLLAGACEDGTVVIWDISSGVPLKILKGHGGTPLTVAFHPNGTLLASGSGGRYPIENSLKIWDVATGKALKTWKKYNREVYSLAFSPDGKTLLTGEEDGVIKLWDTTAGRPAKSFKRHNRKINSVRFSPDGKLFASAGSDTLVKVWSIENNQELLTLDRHYSFVTTVAFSSNGKMLITGSYDTSLKLWEVATGQELLTIKGHLQPVTAAAFTPDSNFVVSGDRSGTIRMWELH